MGSQKQWQRLRSPDVLSASHASPVQSPTRPVASQTTTLPPCPTAGWRALAETPGAARLGFVAAHAASLRLLDILKGEAVRAVLVCACDRLAALEGASQLVGSV